MNKDNTKKREALMLGIWEIKGREQNAFKTTHPDEHEDVARHFANEIIDLVEQALSDKGEYREKYLMACAMLSEEQKHNYNLQGRICRQRDEITMLHKKLSPPQE